MTCRVDHLVIAAPSLEAGAAWCERVLGATPGPGGRHALMGTHNRLLAISSAAFPQAYLEIIAIDPEAPPPDRVRWFGLDEREPDAPPRLIHVVMRSDDLAADGAAMRAAGADPGPVVAASRESPQGPLRWRISVRDDGRLLAGGALPTLIEWGSTHPTAAMAPSAVALQRLVLRGWPPALRSNLAGPGVEWRDDAGAALAAGFDTPIGAVTLHSMPYEAPPHD